MKHIRRILVGLLLALSLACCVKQEVFIVYPYVHQTQTTPNGAIVFGEYSPATKAMAGVGPNAVGYDSFRVFGFEDNIAIMDPFQVQWQSNKWVYDGIGTQELQYFNRNAEQYSFIGIVSDKVPTRTGQVVDVAGVEAFQTNDEMNSPKEFLYAQEVVPSANFGQYVNLAFNHGNARMFIGFASDRNDTELVDYAPGHAAIPAVQDTTDTWFNLKRGTNVDGSATKLKGPGEASYTDNVALPAALVAEIKSYYSIDGGAAGDYDLHLGNTQWPSATVKQLRIVKNIPDEYKLSCEALDGTVTVFFDGFKYLKDNGYDIQPRNSGGKPAIWDYVLLDAFVNGSAYTVVGFNAAGLSYSNPNYTIDETPAVPAVETLEGIRVFSVDDSGTTNVHKVHTNAANAHVAITGLATFDNLVSDSEVIVFDLPVGVVAQAADTNIPWASATPSPTIRYALPVENTGYVVKFSYRYNGTTYYDARVLIPTVSADFVQSKDYTYVIYITGQTNGTTDPGQASDDKDEVDTDQKAIVFSEVTFGSYSSGGHHVYTIL